MDPGERAAATAKMRAWRAANPDKVRAANAANRGRVRAWHTANPDRVREHARRSHLRRNHGMDEAEFAALWEAQAGLCYLCDDPLGEGHEVAIDHDHRCCPPRHSCRACRRGLACNACNVAVGQAQDDPSRLRLIAARLETAQAAAADRIAGRPVQESLL